MSSPNTPLDYQTPMSAEDRKKHRLTLAGTIAKWSIGGLAVLALCAAVILLMFNSVDQPPPSSLCATNVKNIAAALVTYANTHNGNYPDSLEELLSSSGMTPTIMVCPESNDAPIADTSPAELAKLSAGGHLSYIYLGKGLTSNASTDTVLMYEPLANHKNRGMNVLFADYRVQFLQQAEANQLLGSIIPGKATVWPPAVAK